MMGKGFYLCMLFVLSMVSLELKSQEQDRHQFKLAGGNLHVSDFYLSNGDTIYERYEKKRLVIENSDSIVYAEFFNNKRHWFLYRYKLINGQPYLYGWQKEFDLDDHIQFERYCELGERQAVVTKKYNYYPNGKLSSVLSYYKNRMDGYCHYYYSNGQLRQNIEYSKGRLMNIIAYYDQDGNIVDIGDFCDGSGNMNVYAMNGKLIQERIYENGKMKKKIELSREED